MYTGLYEGAKLGLIFFVTQTVDTCSPTLTVMPGVYTEWNAKLILIFIWADNLSALFTKIHNSTSAVIEKAQVKYSCGCNENNQGGFSPLFFFFSAKMPLEEKLKEDKLSIYFQI